MPYYLSIGMTADEFWNKDCCLARYYREAEKQRCEKTNWAAWLQGAYIYEAILCASPRLNSMKPKKPAPYRKKPYEMNAEDKKTGKRKTGNDDAALAFMTAFAMNTNKKFKDREARKNAGG